VWLRRSSSRRRRVLQAAAPELDKAEAALTRTGTFLQAHLQLTE
jgi:hypothetical protein